MITPPKPPRDYAEEPDESVADNHRRGTFAWLAHPSYRFALSLNVLVMLVSAVAILLTSEPNIQVEPRKATRQLFTIVFTIALVELTWNVVARAKQEKQLKDDRHRLIHDVHGELQKLYKIRDTAVLAVDTQLSLPSRIDECTKDIFIVKIFLPGAQKFFDLLKPRIKKGAVETINLIFLDNRLGNDGARLHQERAETMYPRRPDDSRLEARNSINAACHFARAVLKDHPALTEFNVYLCNQLPTISITQLSDKRAYLAFFFYNVNSVDSPQLHVDLGKGKSSIVRAYEGHKRELLSRIRQQHDRAQAELDLVRRQKYIFNLRKEEDIKELEATQEISALLNVPSVSSGPAGVGLKSTSV